MVIGCTEGRSNQTLDVLISIRAKLTRFIFIFQMLNLNIDLKSFGTLQGFHGTCHSKVAEPDLLWLQASAATETANATTDAAATRFYSRLVDFLHFAD